jgi:hypothetical protein
LIERVKGERSEYGHFPPVLDRITEEGRQLLKMSMPQQQGGQSDTSSSGSTGGSNDADTTTNNEAPLGEITSSLEDLFD